MLWPFTIWFSRFAKKPWHFHCSSEQRNNLAFYNLVINVSFFFFLQIHHLTLGLMSIGLHNLFWFIFYGVMLVLWLGFGRLTQVDSANFFCSFFNWFFFLTSSISIVLIDNLTLYFFYLLSMGLSWSHNLDRKFCRLARLVRVFFVPFLIGFFSIPTFSIGLIENLTL